MLCVCVGCCACAVPIAAADLNERFAIDNDGAAVRALFACLLEGSSSGCVVPGLQQLQLRYTHPPHPPGKIHHPACVPYFIGRRGWGGV